MELTGSRESQGSEDPGWVHPFNHPPETWKYKLLECLRFTLIKCLDLANRWLIEQRNPPDCFVCFSVTVMNLLLNKDNRAFYSFLSGREWIAWSWEGVFVCWGFSRTFKPRVDLSLNYNYSNAFTGCMRIWCCDWRKIVVWIPIGNRISVLLVVFPSTVVFFVHTLVYNTVKTVQQRKKKQNVQFCSFINVCRTCNKRLLYVQYSTCVLYVFYMCFVCFVPGTSRTHEYTRNPRGGWEPRTQGG